MRTKSSLLLVALLALLVAAPAAAQGDAGAPEAGDAVETSAPADTPDAGPVDDAGPTGEDAEPTERSEAGTSDAGPELVEQDPPAPAVDPPVDDGPALGGPALDGPELDLEGLDLGLSGAPAEGEGSGEQTGDNLERFDERTDQLVSLADRAAAIVDTTTLGGYGEHEFVWGPNEISRFVAHRYILFVYSKITDRISTATEIEFEFAGSPLKRDGALTFGEVLLEFAVVDLAVYDWLVFRAGVILVPVGAFNIRHDAPTRDLSERPIAYTTIVPSTWFESGAGLLGDFEMPFDGRLSYELYVINGLDARIFDGVGLRGARGSHLEDNNNDKAIVGRVAYSPMLGAEVGVSGYTGQYDKDGNRVNMANVDATLRTGPLELLGEVVGVMIDPGYVEGVGRTGNADTRDAVPEGMWGFYAQANMHLRYDPLWATFPDWLQESVFTAVVRYEGKDTDVFHESAQGDQRRLTLGLNFRPVEPYVIKTDLQFNGYGVDQSLPAPELWDARMWDPENIRLMTSVAFLF
jgi:hypothetical protein